METVMDYRQISLDILTEAATWGVFVIKDVLRNFAKFTGKHLARVSFLI